MSSETGSRSRVWTRARLVGTWLTTSRSRGSTPTTSAQQTSSSTTEGMAAGCIGVWECRRRP